MKGKILKLLLMEQFEKNRNSSGRLPLHIIFKDWVFIQETESSLN